MLSACQDKYAAWEFIRTLFLPQYESDDAYKNNPVSIGFPVVLSDYDWMKRYQVGKTSNANISASIAGIADRVTPEHAGQFEDLVDHVDKITLGDREIYHIVYETASAYFAGDKTLDETAGIIQNRVSLYVNEQKQPAHSEKSGNNMDAALENGRRPSYNIWGISPKYDHTVRKGREL